MLPDFAPPPSHGSERDSADGLAEAVTDDPLDAGDDAPLQVAANNPPDTIDDALRGATAHDPLDAGDDAPLQVAANNPPDTIDDALRGATAHDPLDAGDDAPLEVAANNPPDTIDDALRGATAHDPLDAGDDAPLEVAANNPPDTIDDALRGAAAHDPLDAGDDAPLEVAANNPPDTIDDALRGAAADDLLDTGDDAPPEVAANDSPDTIDDTLRGAAAEDPLDTIDHRPEGAVGDSPDAATGVGTGSEHDLIDARESTFEHPLAKSLILDPTRWRLWPAVAVLRWMERMIWTGRKLAYRSNPTLSFVGSEIHDIRFSNNRVAVVLNAAGLACAGSALPTSDIARIIADTRQRGALNDWLDGICDRFMHALERMQSQSHTAFAIATGGSVEAHVLVCALAGRTTPLHAAPNGAIFHGLDQEPAGAIGLARVFVGHQSARGLEALFAALTGLSVRVEEFTGAEIDVARPARLGGRIGKLLGRKCRSPEAGVDVHIEGESNEEARKWASDPVRRRTLHTLATTYVGADTPAVRFVLWLDPDNVPEGRLDGTTTLGGMAVLGGATSRIALPIEIGAG